MAGICCDSLLPTIEEYSLPAMSDDKSSCKVNGIDDKSSCMVNGIDEKSSFLVNSIYR